RRAARGSPRWSATAGARPSSRTSPSRLDRFHQGTPAAGLTEPARPLGQGRTAALTELDRPLGQPVPEALDGRARHARLLTRTEADEQRREVFDARMRTPGGWGFALKVQHGVDVSGGEHLVAPLVELHRPGRRWGVGGPGHRIHLAQVVSE